ncbi:uncharacterized protein CLUP02_03839 [Colletotrichum lupini]|uniref:Uncharacterized protein n=1 Tax=Colletotrichum lupini TaxID=145971 RepID=A0A9Q8SKZ4_9PEZI|nr:uncharacterized protein CLUP02_03839 [Colletotrichum lupini]UQC78362.1 hypothetical protein CLUP02_03839 [Colletotrichum lupini]
MQSKACFVLRSSIADTTAHLCYGYYPLEDLAYSKYSTFYLVTIPRLPRFLSFSRDPRLTTPATKSDIHINRIHNAPLQRGRQPSRSRQQMGFVDPYGGPYALPPPLRPMDRHCQEYGILAPYFYFTAYSVRMIQIFSRDCFDCFSSSLKISYGYQTDQRPRVPPLRKQKGQDHFGGDAAGKSSTLIRTNELWLVGPAEIGDGSSTGSKPASSFGQTIADGRLSVSQLQLQTKPKRSRALDSCLSQTWNIDAAALLLCPYCSKIPSRRIWILSTPYQSLYKSRRKHSQ